MLLNLLAGLPVMLFCLLMQAVFITICLRYYVHFRHAQSAHESQWLNILLLSMVMLLMSLSNFVQIAIWATLFMLLDEFDEFLTALYHSAVNFATLGYGDIVMSSRWRLLGPLEAANGILMFGVSTSVMTAAVMDVIKHSMDRLKQREHP
ncbi:potassium channel family protein [Pseudomonas lini]|uniref:Ion channel n=1 Tax=Pseudomonas lini TaxID=163011 RepID=A0A0J6HA27_9PSED|nr:potassium channel family protein [Pseudomonas lini]KAB0502189.1 two pore domain potassium channel family protein [Pseudomonas lini]KMM90550.1 transporter [Pseudomonas lini]KNH47772.1 transporter [Pseudomonas lini]NSX09483.1 two pore domain potassium channel family protein [Pseudomonas lini]SDS65919.1 Ion channel [Pseudomonas lini]